MGSFNMGLGIGCGCVFGVVGAIMLLMVIAAVITAVACGDASAC